MKFRKFSDRLRYVTAPFRVTPDYLIVGSQKCGTTSLYKYLAQHPCSIPISPIGHRRKEIRYFTKHFQYEDSWYKAHFPTVFYKYYIRLRHGCRLTVGETSPSYMYNPHAAHRIHRMLPHVKMFILLRNPIDRAYSHYQHVVRLGKEDLSFEKAIDSEPERLREERERVLSDKKYTSIEYDYHSYVERGIYADQIERLLQLFPRENILIFNTEKFFLDPKDAHRKSLEFLNLPVIELNNYREYNSGTYENMDPIIRKRLLELFQPHNERLYELIGERYPWD